jgi:hypothetical protein
MSSWGKNQNFFYGDQANCLVEIAPQRFFVGVLDFELVAVAEGVSVTVGVEVGTDVKVIVEVGVLVQTGGNVGTMTA